MTLKASLTLGLYLAATSDLASTRYALHRGAHEVNPIAGQSFSRQAIVAYASAASSDYLTRKLHPDHPKWATALKIAFIATRGFATVHNVKVSK